MATAATIHAAIITALDAAGDGSVLRPSTLPWSLDGFPESLHNGGFLLFPVDEEDGAATAGAGTVDAIAFDLLIPWRLTGGPNAAAQACMAAVRTARTALDAGPIGDARIDVVGATYATSADGHRLVATVRLVAHAYISL